MENPRGSLPPPTGRIDTFKIDSLSVRFPPLFEPVISSASGPGMCCCNAVTIEHRVQWVPLTDHATSLIARVWGNRRKRNKTADHPTMTVKDTLHAILLTYGEE